MIPYRSLLPMFFPLPNNFIGSLMVAITCIENKAIPDEWTTPYEYPPNANELRGLALVHRVLLQFFVHQEGLRPIQRCIYYGPLEGKLRVLKTFVRPRMNTITSAGYRPRLSLNFTLRRRLSKGTNVFLRWCTSAIRS